MLLNTLRSSILLFILGCVLTVSPDHGLAQESQEDSKSPLLATAQMVPFELEPHQIAELRLMVSLPEGYKAYEDQFKVEVISPEGFKLAKPQIRPVKEIFDKFSKKNRRVVIDKASIIVPVEAPQTLQEKTDRLKLRLTYQACTDTYCLFPKHLELDANFSFKGVERPMQAKIESYSSWMDLKFSDVVSKGLLITFVFVFIFGFLTSLTPCVFPMIPITIAVLGKEAHARTKTKNLLVSIIYVLGIATTYSLLGVLAAYSGVLFGSFMSHPLVLGAVCLVFLLMSLGMFGLYEFEMPRFLRDGPLSHLELHGYSGVFVSGLLAGVVASPCVGPVLVGILTFVAQTQNLWLGFWLLFVYALGMGVLFIGLGVSSQLTKLLPRSGAWMDSVKHFFGLLMLGAFFYYWSLLVPSRVFDVSLGLAFISLGSVWGAFKAVQKPTPAKFLFKGLMQMFVILGSAFVIVGALNLRPKLDTTRWIDPDKISTQKSSWPPYSDEALQAALAEGKPVIIDFFAEWCAACHELEQYTFTDAQVQLLAQQFTLLKFDATKDSEKLTQLRKKYGIVGLPTLIFYSKSGEWMKEQTLTEFEEAPKFVERMKKALAD